MNYSYINHSEPPEIMRLRAENENKSRRIAYFEKLFEDSKFSDMKYRVEGLEQRTQLLEDQLALSHMVLEVVPQSIICKRCFHHVLIGKSCEYKELCPSNHYSFFVGKP